MTRLILEIPGQKALDALLPLLKYLKIRFTKIESPADNEGELAEAIKIVSMGCDMSTFGDALEYQIETRKDYFPKSPHFYQNPPFPHQKTKPSLQSP